MTQSQQLTARLLLEPYLHGAIRSIAAIDCGITSDYGVAITVGDGQYWYWDLARVEWLVSRLEAPSLYSSVGRISC